MDFKDGLGTITLNRPPVNVLNIAMMEEMNDVLKSWIGMKDLKVVLFKAKGKCFFGRRGRGGAHGGYRPQDDRGFHRIFRLMDNLGV